MTDHYNVKIVKSAEQDLKHIYDYIKQHDCIENAKYLFNQLRETVKKLENMPHRGTYLSELYEYGILEYRQINFKVYRIIYSIDENQKQVFVELIIDCRRNVKPIVEDLIR